MGRTPPRRTVMKRALCALLLCALSTVLVTPIVAFGEEGMQGTLDSHTPEDSGNQPKRQLVTEWPRHPTDVEIKDAADRFQVIAGWQGADGWTEANMLASMESAQTYKVHRTGEDQFFSGDPATGDAVFMLWIGQQYAWEETEVDPVDGMVIGGGLEGALDFSRTQPRTIPCFLEYDTVGQKFEFDIYRLDVLTLDLFYEKSPYKAGWVDGSGTEESDAPLPWKTITTGALAVTAAATAMAGAAASAATKTGKKLDSKRPVGFILQLSTMQLLLSETEIAPLEATVWRVHADATTTLATDATILISAPPGVAAQPANGQGTVSAQVWQSGDVSASSSLQITARAPGGGTQATVRLVTDESSKLTLAIDGEEGHELVASGSDNVTVVARLVLSSGDAAGAGVDPTMLRSDIEFTMDSEWLDPSRPVDWPPDGRAIRVQASQPDPDHPVQPPESATVTASVTANGKPLTASIAIPLARNPVIDAKPDQIEFFAESEETVDSLVWIDHAGPGQWEFSATWRENHRPLAHFEIERSSATACVVHLTEASKPLPPIGQPEESSQLVVRATSQGYEPLERYIQVIVTREGLFVDPATRNRYDNTFHIDARGSGEPTQIDVRVFARAQDGSVRYDPALTRSVTWTPAGPEKSPARAALEHDSFDWADVGKRPSESPSEIYEFSLKRVLPTGPRPLHAVLLAQVDGHDEPSFTKEVPLTLYGVDLEPFSDAWDLERERCLYVINSFMPAEYRSKWQQIVLDRAGLMGADGLFMLRHKIWDFSENMLHKEYLDAMIEAHEWEQWEMAADWISWLCDMAIQVATGSYAGTAAMTGIMMVKPFLVSAVTCVIEGRDLSTWVAEETRVFIGALEGSQTDVDVLTNLAGSRARAWAIFVAYWTARDLYDNWQNPDCLSAVLKSVAARCRDAALVSWMRVVAGTSTVKPGTQTIFGTTGPKDATSTPSKPDTSTKPGTTKPAKSPQTRGREIAARVRAERGADGTLPADLVSEIMRDPDAAREMKQHNPDAYQAYVKARQGMREAHDMELKGRLEERYPPGTEIRVETVGTEGGIDRDCRVTRRTTDPKTGAEVWVEIPRGEWEADSHQIFGKQTGAKPGATPAELAEHAQQHQHLTTDRTHHEACEDMSDQVEVTKPDGTKEWTQRTRTDPKTGKQVPASNLDMVKDGQGKLINAKELGRTYERKVADSMGKGPDGKPFPTRDAFTQAKKASDTMDGVKSGYQKRGTSVKPTDPKVRQGQHIVDQVASGKWKAGEGDRMLKQAGFKGGLADYIKAVSGEIGELPDATNQ